MTLPDLALSDLPWTQLRALYDALLAQGRGRGDAAAEVARWVDEQIDLGELVPGPVGQVLEALDRPLIRAAVHLGLRYTRRGA